MLLGVTFKKAKIYCLILMSEIINGRNLTYLAKALEVVVCHACLVAQDISCPKRALQTQWHGFQSHPAYKTRRWLIWLLSRVQCFAASRIYSDSPVLVHRSEGGAVAGCLWPMCRTSLARQAERRMAVLRCRAVQGGQHCFAALLQCLGIHLWFEHFCV